ncbi:UNVERIFIED_CONTAM: hypothetical protein FKN15_014441 [Acipenser sinensis]
MQSPKSYSVGGQRSSRAATGKPAGVWPGYRGRWCAGRWKSVSSEGGGAMAPELSDPDGKRRGIRGLEERMRSLTSGSWARNTKHDPELQPQASKNPDFTTHLFHYRNCLCLHH